MTVTARTPLGASTTNRKWWIDVIDPGTEEYIGVHGIGEFKFKPGEGSSQDNSDFDSEGFKSNQVTALTWGGEGKLHRKTQASDPLAYDPGQEVIRLAAMQIGVANRVQVRVYEMEPDGPRVEAYEGFASAKWNPDGGNMEALDTVSFVLDGQGKPDPITHPDGVVGAPAITEDVLPANTAATGTIVIRGARFTGVAGAAGVKIGGVNATSYVVLDDDTITAVVPAGSAGSAPIIVTHGTNGASAPRPYNRGV